LLCDGLGDTIRVSLSEAPEAEIPVARKLVDYVLQRENHPYIPGAEAAEFNYTNPNRRHTTAVENIGGEHVPVVISARLDGNMQINEQFCPDYIYCGQQLPEMRRTNIGYIVDANIWKGEEGTYPAFNYQQLVELHHSKENSTRKRKSTKEQPTIHLPMPSLQTKFKPCFIISLLMDNW
jgi:(E)-4-hydroxy-3-methylbut-2-enyl-diphosphate synthase